MAIVHCSESRCVESLCDDTTQQLAVLPRALISFGTISRLEIVLAQFPESQL